MNRTEVLQEFIARKKYSTYIEIGTYKGASFLPLKCLNKMAVDPYMHISWRRKLKWMIKNPYNVSNKYFELTSDEFFRKKSQKLEKMALPSLFFIDGLHTFKASLQDVLNSLKYTRKGGLIVMHDCYPPSLAAATPARSFKEAKEKSVKGWTGQWCGDVWKTIVYLKNLYPQTLDVVVLNTDFGLGIVKIKNEDILDTEIEEVLFNEVNSMLYEDVLPIAIEVLNLKGLDYINQIDL